MYQRRIYVVVVCFDIEGVLFQWFVTTKENVAAVSHNNLHIVQLCLQNLYSHKPQSSHAYMGVKTPLLFSTV